MGETAANVECRFCDGYRVEKSGAWLADWPSLKLLVALQDQRQKMGQDLEPARHKRMERTLERV